MPSYSQMIVGRPAFISGEEKKLLTSAQLGVCLDENVSASGCVGQEQSAAGRTMARRSSAGYRPEREQG